MKAGDRTETGVTALGHGGSTEYLDLGGTKVRRRWNHDGTAAVDDVLTDEEYKEATKAKPTAAASASAVPAGMPAETLKLTAAQEEAIAKYKQANQPKPFTTTQAGAAPVKK